MEQLLIEENYLAKTSQSFVNIIRIKFYIFGYPLNDDLPNNAILMNVDFSKF
jgi:hypothetical protein